MAVLKDKKLRKQIYGKFRDKSTAEIKKISPKKNTYMSRTLRSLYLFLNVIAQS
jgi:hypothetical protein